MKTYNLNQMVKGWFIGDFQPTVLKAEGFEVGIKNYKKGDLEKRHFHKISTEYTVIASGKVRMNEQLYEEGSIVEIMPGESTDFEALEDTITVVVKVPSSKNDKYLVEG